MTSVPQRVVRVVLIEACRRLEAACGSAILAGQRNQLSTAKCLRAEQVLPSQSNSQLSGLAAVAVHYSDSEGVVSPVGPSLPSEGCAALAFSRRDSVDQKTPSGGRAAYARGRSLGPVI